MNAGKLREAAERVLQYPIEQGCAGHEQFAQDLKLAADACTTLAAQMESAEQGFKEHYPHADFKAFAVCSPENTEKTIREMWNTAWHAATAQMQAKLDYWRKMCDEHDAAHEARTQAMADMQAKLDAAKALLDAAARNVDVKVIESLQRELDAANEKVRELEAKIMSLPHYDNCEKWVKADVCDGIEYIIEETRKCTCELER